MRDFITSEIGRYSKQTKTFRTHPNLNYLQHSDKNPLCNYFPTNFLLYIHRHMNFHIRMASLRRVLLHHIIFYGNKRETFDKMQSLRKANFDSHLKYKHVTFAHNKNTNTNNNTNFNFVIPTLPP